MIHARYDIDSMETVLNELDKTELRDVTRHISNMPDEEFDKAWKLFQEEKRKRTMS